MAVPDVEKAPRMKVSVSLMANEVDEDKSEFDYLRPARSLWRMLWQTLKNLVDKSNPSPGPGNIGFAADFENDGFHANFETWVHNRYKKRILYRYDKDFVMDMVALQSMCTQFRLKRISEQALDIITSTPESIGELCKGLDIELREYTNKHGQAAALRDMEYMNKFGLTSNVEDPFTITTETTSQQVMLRDAAENLLKPGSEGSRTTKNRKRELRKLLCSELGSEVHSEVRSEQKSVPEPRDRKKEYKISQQPDYWFRRKALGKYMRLFKWALVGNVFLIGPMIFMVLKPGLVTSLITTSVCVTVFAAVAPKFLDKIGDVMSATAAYAAVLVVFVGTSGGGTSV